MSRYLYLLLLAAALLMLPGCNGGDDEEGGGASLDGTWGGTVQDEVGDLGAITASISGSSLVVNTPGGTYSGTITHEQGSIYSYYIEGTDGGFLVDSTMTHAAFVDEFGVFGVLQKGASGPAGSYAVSDLYATWSGGWVEVDPGLFELVATGTATVTVNASTLSGSSSSGDTFSGSTPGINDASYGRYDGTIISNFLGGGNLTIFLTPDKQFSGSVAQFDAPTVTFNYWRRQ